jgi:hypothetical protein
MVKVQGLREGSGIAVSRHVPDRIYTHNDSGKPILLVLDAQGRLVSRLVVLGASVTDWEAIAVGPCGSGSCIYVGDIGDNDARRRQITIYRAPEPDVTAAVIDRTEVFHATYPDGAHDAESLLVGPDGRLYIVTKGATGPVGIYRFPAEVRSGSRVVLERVGGPAGGSRVAAAERITDGSISADGQWAVLRTNRSLAFHRASALLGGTWQELGRTDLRPLGEPQGEGVAFGPAGTIYVVGESGGRGSAGSFARLTCSR